MDLDDLLLLVAFRRRIKEADSAAGQARVEAIVGQDIDPAAFATAVRRLVAGDLIHDPVFLPAGALQCHWRLEPTPDGVAAVQAIVQRRSMSADALIGAV